MREECEAAFFENGHAIKKAAEHDNLFRVEIRTFKWTHDA
jgi:hypothetical protein